MTNSISGSKVLNGKVNLKGSYSLSSYFLSLSGFSSLNHAISNTSESYGISTLKELIANKQNLKEININFSEDWEVIFAIPPLVYKGYKVNLLYEKEEAGNILGIRGVANLCLVGPSINGKIVFQKELKIEDSLKIDGSKMPTDLFIFTVLLCLALDTKLTVLNVPQDPRITVFLRTLENLSLGNIDYDPSNFGNFSLITGKSLDFSIDINIFPSLNQSIFFLLLSGCGGVVSLLDTDPSLLLPINSKLNNLGVNVETSSKTEIKVWGVPSLQEQVLNIEIKPYPGFDMSWGLLFLVYLAFFGINASIKFPANFGISRFVFDLNRLGASLEIIQSELFDTIIVGKGSIKGGKKIILEERRFVLPYLLFALLMPGKTTIVNFDLVKTYYGDLLENLNLLGADIKPS